MKRTVEFKDDKSSKFWSIEVNGNELTVTYGKTGTAGQSQTKSFADNDTCTKEADKLIAEKLKKGYAEDRPDDKQTENVETTVRLNGDTEVHHTFGRTPAKFLNGVIYGFEGKGYELTEFMVEVDGVAFNKSENPQRGDNGVFKVEKVGETFSTYIYCPTEAGVKRIIKVSYLAIKPVGDLSILTEDNYSHIAAVTDAQKANKTYSIEDDINYPFLDYADDQDTCVYKGDLRLSGIDAGSQADWNAYNLIVDGNLTVDGNIDWADYGRGSFLLVTGNLKVKNLIMQGCPNITIRGSLTVENGIMGHHGDDGGELTVKGETTAKVIINASYFNMQFDSQPSALVVGVDGCDSDFEEADLKKILVGKFWNKEDEYAEDHEIADALRKGEPVIKASVLSRKNEAENPKKGYVEEGIATTALSGTEVEKAKQALDMLNKWLEGKGIEERIEFSKPVPQKEIAKAEKELGVNIPPSYVEFVTKYGTFSFDGELLGRGSGNDTCLLSPTELVEQTNDYREEFAEYGDGIEDYDDTNEDEIDPDMDAYKILRDGLLYLASPKGECFEVFVISSADADGEMKVRHFDYSDLGMNDGWHEGDETFYSTIAEMIQLIKQKNE